MSCLIRDDLHMTAHQHSNRHLLTPALKEIWQERAEHLLQWHAENRHENILFRNEKIFNARITRIVLKGPVRQRKTFQGCRETITLPMSWFGGGYPIRGWHLFIFCEKGVKLVPKCIKRTCYKQLWNIFTWPSSMARNGSSSRTPAPAHKAKTTQEWLWRNLLAFSSADNWPSGSADLNLWTISCGLFWRTQHAESITTVWRAWKDPSWMQRQRYPRRQCMRQQQSGQNVSRLALKQTAAILSDTIISENLKLLKINYLAQKVDVLFNFPSRSHCTCNRT